MNQTDKNTKDLAVTLTVEQLRALVRDEIEAAMRQNGKDKLLTPEELADRFKVPLSWIYEQSRQGNIPTHRIGRYIRFNFLEVLASQEKKD